MQIAVAAYVYFIVLCPKLINEQLSCPNRTIGDTCLYSCPAGYELHGLNNVTCLLNGSWSDETSVCVPLTCPNITVPTAMMSSSCNYTYQSQCTASCDEGFTGDDVTYLCNVTSDPTMVGWVPIGGVDVMCERGLLNLAESKTVVSYLIIHSSLSYADEWKPCLSKWSYYRSV